MMSDFYNTHSKTLNEYHRIAHNIKVEACDKSCLYKTGAVIAGLTSLIPKGRPLSLCVLGIMGFQAVRMDFHVIDCQNYQFSSIHNAYLDLLTLDYKSNSKHTEPDPDQLKKDIDKFERVTLHHLMGIKIYKPQEYLRAKQFNGFRNLDPNLSFFRKLWMWSVPLEDNPYD